MAQKKDRILRTYNMFGAIGLAAVVGVLLALTCTQPQPRHILQDKPQGISGLQAGSLLCWPKVPSEESGGMRNATEPVPSQPACASITISQNPTRAGSEVKISGGGFTLNSKVSFAFDGKHFAGAQATASANGDFVKAMFLGMQKGEYAVKAAAQFNKVASVTFNVT